MQHMSSSHILLLCQATCVVICKTVNAIYCYIFHSNCSLSEEALVPAVSEGGGGDEKKG